ncbi:radical SAM/SPASM domain-containing protein [Fibrobacterota bacterium]
MKIIDYNYGLRWQDLLVRHKPGMIKSITIKKAINSIIFLWEFQTKSIIARSKPFYLIIEPTNHCDHSCPRCGTHSNRTKGFMDFDLYKEIIDFYKFYCMKISLYGQGESFLHKEIFEMIAYSEINKCPVTISSNFNCLTPVKLQNLLDSGLHRLIVCVDGASQESHARYRQNGDLNKVLTNLRTLAELKAKGGYKNPTIEVQTIAFSYIKNELNSISKMVKECGADIHLIRKDMFSSKANPCKKKDCPALWGAVFITWNGIVFPCEQFCNKLNLRALDFKVIKNGTDFWNDNLMINARSILRQKNKNNYPVDIPCSSCFHFPKKR